MLSLEKDVALRLNKAKTRGGMKGDAFTLCHHKHPHIQIIHFGFKKNLLKVDRVYMSTKSLK